LDPDMNVSTLYERDGYWDVSQLANYMNNGLNFINHLGHSNTDYNMKFYNNTVTNQNITANGIDNNFFLIYSQGCLPAAIETDCIAEKFTTIENGCVAFIGNTRYGWYMPGGTNSSSQFMDRQFWDATFDEDITQISAMNTDSKEDGAAMVSGDAWFRWSYYCIIVLGDPTLDVWTETPAEIEATYQPSISIGASQIPFQTDTPYARIALMQNGELIGRAVADEFGDVLLETFEPIITLEEITVSIIGHNKTRHLGTMVVVSNEPYVIIDSYEVNDPTGNGNNLPDFGESITLDMTLQNVGNQIAENITATISTEDTYVTITNDSADFGSIAIQGSTTLAEAFAMDIADNVPDQHEVNFQLEATDGTIIWTSNFEMIINAPEFEATDMQIVDSAGNNNGILDPGETATVNVPVQNIGHALSPQALAALTTNNNLVTIENPISDLGTIEAGFGSNAVYTVTADISLAVGTMVEFNLTIIAGSYSYENVFSHQIGLIVENFESGDFSAFPWEFTSNVNWTISNGAHEGSYCAKSGAIGNYAFSNLKLEIDVTMDGDLSFWRTVSSEANYDYLKFFIDGSLIEQWSGDVTWEEETYNITAGSHILEWRYDKDLVLSGGTDCARLDYILFPPLGVIFPPIMTVNPSNLNIELATNTISTETIEIGNIGGEVLTYTITFTNSPDWLTADPLTGDVLGGEVEEVTLTFDTTDLTAGQYNSALVILDGMGGHIIVPVTLVVTGTGTGNDLIPMQTELYGNYPNPFNPTTSISYGLNTDSRVVLNIFNMKGQKVVTLVNEIQDAGYHQIHWSGTDENDKQVTSGVYFYEMDVLETDYTSVKKMILLK
ncbi:MAG: C25 family cysteine peptidase, partial [Candidatus Cloacimonadales bacterium]|nr:C25 family cysteine peptidase [Candidatus Cloacimonadales bacterium]